MSAATDEADFALGLLSSRSGYSFLPRRVADNGNAGGYISRDNAPSAHNCIVTDCDTWQDDGTPTYPDIRTYRYRPTEAHFLSSQPGVPWVISGEYLNSRTDGRAFTD